VRPAAKVRLIVWCKACQHQVEPNLAEMAARYGSETTVLDWRERQRLVCSKCGSREINMAVRPGRSGERRQLDVAAAPAHFWRR